MAIQKQYVVPILMEKEDTWSKIAMYTQPLRCLYDRHGNLKDCRFARVENQWLGEFRIFQSLDKKVAETVYGVLSQDRDLTVLPIREVDYETHDSLAGIILEESIREGKEISIPSLNITITP